MVFREGPLCAAARFVEGCRLKRTRLLYAVFAAFERELIRLYNHGVLLGFLANLGCYSGYFVVKLW
jgi:hypothetical protein